jgi:hypothetical protein
MGAVLAGTAEGLAGTAEGYGPTVEHLDAADAAEADVQRR